MANGNLPFRPIPHIATYKYPSFRLPPGYPPFPPSTITFKIRNCVRSSSAIIYTTRLYNMVQNIQTTTNPIWTIPFSWSPLPPSMSPPLVCLIDLIVPGLSVIWSLTVKDAQAKNSPKTNCQLWIQEPRCWKSFYIKLGSDSGSV